MLIDSNLIEAWRKAEKAKTNATLWCQPKDMHKNLQPGGYLYEKFAIILAELDQAGWKVVRKETAAHFPSDAEIDAAAVAMFFRNVMPVSQESIDRFKRSDAWPVWRDQALAGLTAAESARNGE
jgi:hypothetical protein